MTGMLKTGALTSTTQLVNVATQPPPFTATLNSTAPTRGIRFSTSRSGAANTFFSPDIDGDTVGAISIAGMATVKWVEFTGAVGDIWEVL